MDNETLNTPTSAPEGARKTARKRGRPRKVPVVKLTPSSLTRTTRKISKPSLKPHAATAATPVKTSVLNRTFNILVVAAVFVTAMAIQHIVPTETVSTPKVEPLPQTATVNPTPVPETPAPDSSSAPAAVPVTEAAAPTATPQKRTAVAKPRKPIADVHTPLNAGGSQDLDGEAARAAYMATTKLATRPAPASPAK